MENIAQRMSVDTRGWGGIMARILVYGLLFLFLAAMTIGLGPLELLLVIAFGWAGFLERIMTEIRVAPAFWAIIAVCFLVMGWGFDRFFRWLLSWMSSKGVFGPEPCVWRRRWVWCGLAAAGLCILVGMSIGGVMHQAGWMLASDEPLWTQKGRARLGGRMDLRRLAEMLDERAGTSVSQLRRDYQSGANGFVIRKGRPIDYYQVIIIYGDDGYEGGLVFPRDQKMRSDLGGYRTGRTGVHPLSIEQLLTLLRQQDRRMEAL